MRKYLKVLKISLQTELAYKANFIMWRLRNIIGTLLVFYLWDTIYQNPGTNLFGYDRSKILTYVFSIIVVKAFVLSSKAVEVAGEIGRGDLSNYLLKPLNYFKYWFARDISNKLVNITFSVFEFLILFLLLKPDFFIQTSIFQLVSFVVSLGIAIVIYFLLIFLVSTLPFWAPELGWGSHFLITVIMVEFLSGSLFPLDILPSSLLKIVLLTPFPYLLFFPVQVYLGKAEGLPLFSGLLISLIWAFGLWGILKIVWNKGLKVYQAYGR